MKKIPSGATHSIVFALSIICLILFVSYSCTPQGTVSPEVLVKPDVSPSIRHNVYYVRTSGSENNPGTRERPFQTIQKAADVMIAGDTCYVGGGTYRERVTLRNSGTKDQPIHFIVNPGEKVTINGADPITGSWIKAVSFETLTSDTGKTSILTPRRSRGVRNYSELYMEGKRMRRVNSLDRLVRPGTWFLEENRLLFIPPDLESLSGIADNFLDPIDFEAEGKVRDYAFDATGINFIVIEDFRFFATKSVKLDPGNASVNVFINEKQWIEYAGFDGPGKGKHIVFVTGDEEYRSEEAMPQMAKILAKHHGFKCTVLFSINEATWEIDPDTRNNIPGLHALESADLMVLFTRSRELPDEQMKYIIDYTNTGKPIIGLRTATHAFSYRQNLSSQYAKYSSRSKEFEGGYGRQVLGEAWVDHYGHHGEESTRGIVADGMNDHPIVKGCDDIWGPTDVYEVGALSGDSKPVIMGQVLRGMTPDDEPNTEKELMPVAWVKTYTGENGNTARVFTTTMGAAPDFESEGLRRLFVNACYWCLEMEDQITGRANINIVGEYKPTFFGFGKFKKGMKTIDYEMK